MLIAVEGCCHGALDEIYESLENVAEEHQKKVDLLICCGDFQSVRNLYDLTCMARPDKYQSMETFYKYYSGEKQAPVLTIFIGGNHEASNYLQELCYGGWVAPNIYFLGYAGVVQFGGIRIGGISGIYKGYHYSAGRYEVPPFNEESKRSIYHIRQLEVFRLKQITRPIDIFISHDWPVGITDYGDVDELLKIKPRLREQVKGTTNILGAPCLWELLQKLKPAHWFAAHMHCRFPAIVPHEGHAPTKFLALDKCLSHVGRPYLHVMELPHQVDAPLRLSHDAEWLGILRETNHLLHLGAGIRRLPQLGGKEEFDFSQTDEQIERTKRRFGSLTILPGDFHRNAPIHETSFGVGKIGEIIETMRANAVPLPPQKSYLNSQTVFLCKKLSLTDHVSELARLSYN